jgi:hypothetical protein
VQHVYKVLTQQMYQESDDAQSTIGQHCQSLIKVFKAIAESICDTPVSPTICSDDTFASEAIDLKHALMISPLGYRIFWIFPGWLFDPRHMRALDRRNQEISDADAGGKTVALCDFPAIMSQESKPFDKDSTIKDVLVKNKRFFLTLEETVDMKAKLMSRTTVAVVSKAVVLVLDEHVNAA